VAVTIADKESLPHDAQGLKGLDEKVTEPALSSPPRDPGNQIPIRLDRKVDAIRKINGQSAALLWIAHYLHLVDASSDLRYPYPLPYRYLADSLARHREIGLAVDSDGLARAGT
jgi:hypothetical protein